MNYILFILIAFQVDMSKYEIEEVDKVWNIRIEIDQAYKIIHSKNYCEVLFSIAENNNSSK